MVKHLSEFHIPITLTFKKTLPELSPGECNVKCDDQERSALCLPEWVVLEGLKLFLYIHAIIKNSIFSSRTAHCRSAFLGLTGRISKDLSETHAASVKNY